MRLLEYVCCTVRWCEMAAAQLVMEIWKLAIGWKRGRRIIATWHLQISMISMKKPVIEK